VKITLRYRESQHKKTCAVFLKGRNAAQWITEIGKWRIPYSSLKCYLVPESIADRNAAGLFVVFNSPDQCSSLQLLFPYISIAEGVYIPLNTELYPQLSAEEMRSIFVWDVQVFLPTIGLVGFEESDQIELNSFFESPQLIEADWSYAHPGISDFPLLQTISVIQPQAKDIIKNIQQEIDVKPLREIPNKKPPSGRIEKTADWLLEKVYSGMIKGLNAINDILPDGGQSDNKGGGAMDNLYKWLSKNLADLEKKRNDELQRLLDLFDNNSDEALQYALPLDSPYFNRGQANPGGRLSKGKPLFDLGRLGGGGPVDMWDVGPYYQQLRSKYLRSAQNELQGKNFKKAAYIYAHLLGDFHNAANALEQGNYYREAAALYKDHLKNKTSAAECFERGRLYTDAIELYKEINRNEKVGDLYRLTGQHSAAEKYYELEIDSKVELSDFLEAARLSNNKLGQPSRAQDFLIDGWKGANRNEECLKQYFRIVEETESESFEGRLKSVYNNHVPPGKMIPFLNVLEHLNKNHGDERVTSTIHEMVYEIVNYQSVKGNTSALLSLKKFFTDDRLIHSDANRFIALRNKKTDIPVLQSMQLDSSIQWFNVAYIKKQFIVLGFKNACLHLARGNWYGNIEYYSWPTQLKTNQHIYILAEPLQSKQIILISYTPLIISRKNLVRNKYFSNGLYVHHPAWLPKETVQVVIKDDKNVAVLQAENKSVTIHEYNSNGFLSASIPCTLAEGTTLESGNFKFQQLFYRRGFYFTHSGHQLLVISEAGKINVVNFESGIRFIYPSTIYADSTLLVSTNSGCILTNITEGFVEKEMTMFSKNAIPHSFVFLSANRFIMIEKRSITYLEYIGDQISETSIVSTQRNIAGVIPGESLNAILVFEENGTITNCILPG
jgi:hypothetical protein